MDYLSSKGYTFLQSYLDKTQPRLKVAETRISISTNGETLFLTSNNVKDIVSDLERIFDSTESFSNISFGVHSNENVILHGINPIENYNPQLLNIVRENVVSKRYNIYSYSGYYFTPEQFAELSETKLKEQTIGLKSQSYIGVKIDSNPLAP